MPFASDLYTWLVAQTAVTSITGNGSAARVYPLASPPLEPNDPVQPTLIYLQVNRQDEEVLNGKAYKVAEHEFVAMAATHMDAHTLSDALESVLDRFRGVMGSSTVKWAQMQDAYDEIDVGTGTFFVISRYRIAYQ
jgi:predicted transcriptional regulator of viral defense system